MASIELKAPELPKEELSKLFDEEVEKFDREMAKLSPDRGGGPLSKIEKMLIKTYLIQKVTGRIDGAT